MAFPTVISIIFKAKGNMKSYRKGYNLFRPGWCTVMDWNCPMGDADRDLE